jgi:hypothetical protein
MLFISILSVKTLFCALLLGLQLSVSHIKGMSISTRTTKSLVLVGGGHAHLQVIKAMKTRPADLFVTLVDPQKYASYSGELDGRGRSNLQLKGRRGGVKLWY